MAKLSNVVGGLLRDLAESHVISDTYAVEIVDVYGRAPVLTQLPVPRLTIREAQLKLRFAISEINDEVTGLTEDELRELWLTTVNDKVVPQALSEIGRN